MRTILLPCLLLLGAAVLPSCSTGGRDVQATADASSQKALPNQEPLSNSTASQRALSPMTPVSTGSTGSPLRDGLAEPVWDEPAPDMPDDSRGGLRTPGLPAVLPMTLDGKINTDS